MMLDNPNVVRNNPFVIVFFVAPPVLVAVQLYCKANAEPYVSARKMPASEPPLWLEPSPPPEKPTMSPAPMTVGMTAMRMGIMRIW